MLLTTMALSSSGKLATWQLILFSALFCLTCLTGLLSLFQGIRAYRDNRMNRATETPQSGSLAPGLVKVRGKAECSQLLIAPFSRKPCCFYKTRIEYYDKKGPLDDQRYIYGWKELRKDVGAQPFFLADATGKVMVDAPKMFDDELDMKQTFDQKIDQSLLPLNEYRSKLGDGDPATVEQALQAAMRSRNQSEEDEDDSSGTSGKSSFRLIEWAVLPGDEFLAIGNYAENSDAHGGNIISRHKDMPFGLSHRIEKGDYDWQGKLTSQARSQVVVGIMLLLGGLIFLVPIIRYLINRQPGLG